MLVVVLGIVGADGLTDLWHLPVVFTLLVYYFA